MSSVPRSGLRTRNAHRLPAAGALPGRSGGPGRRPRSPGGGEGQRGQTARQGGFRPRGPQMAPLPPGGPWDPAGSGPYCPNAVNIFRQPGYPIPAHSPECATAAAGDLGGALDDLVVGSSFGPCPAAAVRFRARVGRLNGFRSARACQPAGQIQVDPTPVRCRAGGHGHLMYGTAQDTGTAQPDGNDLDRAAMAAAANLPRQVARVGSALRTQAAAVLTFSLSTAGRSEQAARA